MRALPDLSYFWDWARLLVVLGQVTVVIGSISLVLRKMPGIPPRVEGARTTLILGLVLLLASSTTARLRNFGEPPTPQLVLAFLATVVLLVWLLRERRAMHSP